MTEKLLQATHQGDLNIRGINIPCAVLEDGTRLLTQEGFLRALGRARTAKGGSGASVAKVPAFMAAKNLNSFISNELATSTTPIIFRTARGALAYGYRADLMPKVCQIYLEARDAGVLFPSQLHIAQKADILMRGLAHVGIIALVDEATGYQEVRDRIALQAILAKYISKELLPWTKRFPDEFYTEMFRLKGWQWQGMKINRPSVVGHYTNDLVYERLAPGVLPELQRLNPPGDLGRRKHRHHQWLTEDIGHPALAKHLMGVIALMRASSSWERLMRLIKRAFPKSGDQTDLDFDD